MFEGEYSTEMLALWCIILFIFSCVASGDHSEAEALLNWRSSFNNQSKATLSSWKNDTDPCKQFWMGISCDESMSVTNISLSNLSLQGTLSSLNYASFPNLLYFNISYNQFYGSIPHDIGNLSSVLELNLSGNPIRGLIPLEIWNLTTLKHLDLSWCDLTGQIPHEIGKLRDLNLLWLGGNSLSGPIPEEIGMLSNLVDLYLGSNSLSGRFPSSIGNLTMLQNLYVYKNNLDGPIPTELWKLNSLIDIQLQYNRFFGLISPFVGNLSNLVVLSFSNNRFSGQIPPSIGNLNNLDIFNLINNSLSGSVPSTIGNMTKLTALYLHSNNFSGQLPQEINNLTSWFDIQLGYNHFSGPLPQNICQKGMLVFFSANDNHFTGPIPRSLKDCSSLSRLRLDNNMIIDNITDAFGVYPNLDFIDVSGNQLHGHLSSKWGKCQNLTQLIVHNNKLSGDIPPELGEATKLGLLNLSSNNFSGQIPKELGKLKSLIELSLSENNFFAIVSSSIRSINQLEILELAANNFSGSISRELGELKNLRVLNLSKNKFDEGIPPEFGELLDLEQLDLSDNLLIGTIPSRLGMLPKLQELNLSHNNLTGTIPSSFSGPMSAMSIVDISYNQLEGHVPIKPAFNNFDALRNNKGLCGNITGLPLCGYSQANGQGPKSKMFLIIFLPLAIPLLIVGASFFLFCRIATKAKRKDEEVPLDDVYCVWSLDREILYEDIIEAAKEFDERYLVGKGSQGSVYRVELPTGDVVAVKKLHSMPSGEISNKKAFTHEIQALTEIEHPNIVKLYGFYSNPRYSILVYEFLEGGSLDNILKNQTQATEFNWNKRMNIIKGVANALFHMHHDCSVPIVHCNISSKNVLLSSEYEEPHIINYGMAKIVNPNSNNMTTFAITFGYAAPEIAFTMKANEKCDVYSFGVLTLEIIMGKHPTELISSLAENSTVNNFLLKDMLDRRLSPLTKPILDYVILITKIAFLCLNDNPQSRPTMEQVCTVLASTPKSYSEDQLHTITVGQLMRD